MHVDWELLSGVGGGKTRRSVDDRFLFSVAAEGRVGFFRYVAGDGKGRITGIA